VVQGVPTAGVIPSGARIEREIEFALASLSDVRLALRTPDFTTAARIEQAINADFGRTVAQMLDSGTVNVDITAARMASTAHVLGRIESLSVEPEQRARVVVDQRSGTIVMGEDVRISRVAVSQGNLTLRIQEAPLVAQPSPFSRGDTVVVPRTEATLTEEPGIAMAELTSGTTLSEVVAGLNALGVSPRDMIDILKLDQLCGCASCRVSGAIETFLPAIGAPLAGDVAQIVLRRPCRACGFRAVRSSTFGARQFCAILGRSTIAREGIGWTI